MKLSFSAKHIDDAPKTHVRVRITEEKPGTTRFVEKDGARWLELGVGPWKEITRRKFQLIPRRIVRAAKQHGITKLALELSRSPFPLVHPVPLPELGSLIAENLGLAGYEFRDFKTKPKEGWKDVEEVLICGETPKDMQAGMKRGLMIAEEVNAARTLANTPGGDMTPSTLAAAAKAAAKGLPITVKTLGKKEIEKLGMGALLGVGKGAKEEPTFTVLEYKGGKGAPIVLAGKGITFDTGGLNLKPSSAIYEMHMDMSGAAAVIHATTLAARLKVKRHVIALIPSAENATSGESYRPGDILKSLSGKTIEVLNTDAEGRLVLADALTYAKRYKPAAVLDVATLTGAAMVALGLHASALLTKDDALADALLASGEESGDYLWRLPLWEEYDDMVKSDFADLANVATGEHARFGGATEGGIFLWQFAKELDAPWAHLDIAPRMTANSGDQLSKGAAGAPVRLLLHFLESWPDTNKPVAK